MKVPPARNINSLYWLNPSRVIPAHAKYNLPKKHATPQAFNALIISKSKPLEWQNAGEYI